MYKNYFLKTVLLVAMLLGGVNLYAQDADVTYDFTGSDWTVSDGTLSNGTVSFTGEGGANFKMNTGYFMMGKSGAYINFPTYSQPVSKIVVTGNSGASTSVKMNIFVGQTAVSTETTGATGTNSYEISSDYQAAGTQYTLKVTSSHNTQITKIEIYYANSSTPSIDADDVLVAYDATSGEIAYTITNPVDGVSLSATTTADWISNIVVDATNSQVTFNTTVNEGSVDRTGTITLTYEGATSKEVTVTQSYFVVDYATLPFSFDGSDITNITGLTASGLSSYTSSPKLKFDSTGDWMVLKISENPGTLSFDIKGNSFSGGTFKVQVSSDGVTFTDLATYTELGDTQNEEFENLAANVRYIKWIYTTKSSGNVALGNIVLTKPGNDPSIVFENTSINVDCSENSGTIGVTYLNVDTDLIEVQFCDAEGEDADYDWITADFDSNKDIEYIIEANEGAERTAYMRVYALDMNADEYYSEIITITQEAYVAAAEYQLATSVVPGKHYIIVGHTSTGAKAMGTTQNSNNRAAVDVTVNENVVRVTPDMAVAEFQIQANMTTGYYNIYEASYNEGQGGYLYAACGTGTGNYMRTEATPDNDGYASWTISIDADGIATIYAANGGRNYMRYNSGNNIFSCYQVGSQKDIYLFERVGDTSIQTATVTIASACTDGDFCYGTFSSPFAFAPSSDLVVSEIAIVDEALYVKEYGTDAVVPANTGVMVSALDGGDYDVVLSSTSGTSVLGEDNCLRPTGAEGISATEMAAADANCLYYRLTMHNGETIGFWWGAADGAAFNVAANKAYLAVPQNLAKDMGFEFVQDGDATEIILNALSEKNDAPAYNMQGQRVANNYKGIVIVNGKKYMNK